MQEKEIFFINGMPRSGSTLLCNILAQNPEFHTTPTSGLSEIVKGIHEFWKTSPMIKASESPEKQLIIIKQLNCFNYFISLIIFITIIIICK